MWYHVDIVAVIIGLVIALASYFYVQSRRRPNLDKKKTIDQSVLLCCKLFISESRNCAVLDAIEQAARLNPETVIVSKFEDQAYNRTWYTLVSYVVQDITGRAIYSPLQQAVLAMVEAAFGAINLELHSGTYPRLGVVDEILFHPLARASLDDAAWLAKAVAADIANQFQVPVFLYDAANPTGKALDTIRRELGYFRPNSMGNQWAGRTLPDMLLENPDDGPSEVSARGGGLPTVQTLGLVHGDSTEIACMLLEPNQIGVHRVQNRVEMLAAEEGVEVEKGYFTDFSQERIIEKYMNLSSAQRD
nr:glutamate formimidoyltransferase [Quercus suber]